MTQAELLAQLRTYLGGALGNAAADEIERLAEDCARFERAARLMRDLHGEPTIETVGQWLAVQGLTAVSGRDAEKIKRCTGVCDG